MATSTLTNRAPAFAPGNDRVTRSLGHPLAYVLTTLLLLGLFGWTFVANPDRVAPTKDPAYYTWRTEALINETPKTTLDIEGAFGMFEGGYRVTAPVIGGFIRQVPVVSLLRTTIVMMTVFPVLIALLLAGFAYRQRRDPLLWHAVALGAGSLLLTPPFVGYLDNVLCLVFLAASLHFIPGTRDSWPSRIAFFGFLFASGLTHPTTLAFFCVVLGAMAAVRLVLRKFDLRSVVRDDGPLLLTAFASAVATVALWTVGIWGKSASLSESALSPPYGSDFFVDRLVLWVKAMTPVLNGPLLLVGLVALLAVNHKRLAEDELTRVSIIWLAPLVGIFGFLAGKAYPYYRFFNTTLSWVLLVGVGMYFAARFFLDTARRGGANSLALVGVLAIVAVIGANFMKGFDLSGWNNAAGGWLSAEERREMDGLRSYLSIETIKDRPVVFVIDDEPSLDFQIWGFTKLSGNTSRYGMPTDGIENAYLYLGSLENYLAGEPTLRGQETYDKLSPALLEDADAGIERNGNEPIVVVASAFNPAGENVDIVESGSADAGDAEVWIVTQDGVNIVTGGDVRTVTFPDASSEHDPSPLEIPKALLGFLVLLVPGYLSLRYFLPDAELADAIGMVPALSLTILSLVGIAALAVTRSAMSAGLVWAIVAVSIVITGALRMRGARGVSPAAPAQP